MLLFNLEACEKELPRVLLFLFQQYEPCVCVCVHFSVYCIYGVCVCFRGMLLGAERQREQCLLF